VADAPPAATAEQVEQVEVEVAQGEVEQVEQDEQTGPVTPATTPTEQTEQTAQVEQADPVTPADPVAPAAQRRGSLVRSGVLSMAALVALGLTRLIHGSLVSRATDQRTYGLVGSLIAVTTIASLLLPAGVASAASKFIPYQQGRADPAAAAAVHRYLSRIGMAGAVGLGLVAALGAKAAFHLGIVDAVQVGVLCLAFSVYSVQKATLYGFGEVGTYVRLELTSSVLAIAATVAIVAAGWHVYLLPLACGYLLFTFGSWWRLRASGQPTAGGEFDRAEVIRYVLLACAGTVCSAGFLQGTQLLANQFAAPHEVAYFAAAVTLVAPAYFLPRALGLVLFPAMARAHGAGDLADVRRHADVSTRALVVPLAPMFVAGVLLAREVLVAFGGPGYAAGGEVLRLILAATYLAVIQVAAVNALSSGEHVRVPVTFGVLGCLTGLAVVALLGGPLGAAGVGLGYLLGTAVTSLGPIRTVWRLHHMSWAGPLARSLGVVLGALLAAQLLDGVLDGAGLGEAARFGVDTGVALAAAVASTVLLRTDLAALLRQARASSGSGQPGILQPAPVGDDR
jgi:O-antigen/teichoic acid export membrane protein